MNELVFGIMSAVNQVEIVAQLCRALAPHRVVIHHDFAQQPTFIIDMPHVEFVPDPLPTGRGSFGFIRGVAHLLDYCLRDQSLKYFQLLSPTCLPIRPVAEFAAHALDETRLQHLAADVDGIDVLASEQAFMNFGYRLYAPADSLRLRALFKASTWYFGADCPEQIQAGLSVRVRPDQALDVRARLGKLAMQAAAAGLLGSHPFGGSRRPYMGSAWFGAGREASRYLVDQCAHDEELAAFSRLVFPAEILISTIMHNGPFRVGQANHLLNGFDVSRPLTFSRKDVERLQPGSKYFGRKFADEPDDPARLLMLQKLGIS